MVRIIDRVVGALSATFGGTVFEVEIHGGSARLVRGSAPGTLVGDFSDVAEAFEIREGTIRAVRKGDGLTLAFSPGIPVDAHQRFRNILGVHQHRISSR
jgi:hypothetical protein